MDRRLGWSLRIREESVDSTWITLKIPRAGAGAAMDRQEIENTSLADVNEVFAEVAARLREANVLAEDATVTDVIRHGLFGAASSLGLEALFTVRTSRATWRLSDADQHVADLVLDTSRYSAGSTEELIEYQMEIELADLTSQATLDATARDEYGLTPTRETKFLRGLEFHGATQLKEKVEAKLDLPDAAAYAALVKMFSDDPEVIRGYRILGAGVERHIKDVYYDTPALDLALAHCYLRIREENGERKLHFRRLTMARQSNLPVQEEIKGVDAEQDFATSWQVVSAVLAKLLKHPLGDGSPGMKAGIRQLGLAPSLTAKIIRLAWVVQSVSDEPDASRRVAKIKLDDVTFDDDAGHQRRHSEIEITGLEDEETAPEYVDNDAFPIFMHSFHQTCARRLFRGHQTPDLHIGTKYHTGLRLFGRIDDVAATFPGGALVRQETDWSDFEPEARSGLLRTAVFLALSALGLSSLGGATSGALQ